MQISRRFQVRAEPAISPVGIEGGECRNQSCRTVSNLNRYRTGAGSDEGIEIGIIRIHDVGFDQFIYTNQVGAENIVIWLERVKCLQRLDRQGISAGRVAAPG